MAEDFVQNGPLEDGCVRRGCAQPMAVQRRISRERHLPKTRNGQSGWEVKRKKQDISSLGSKKLQGLM